MRQAYRKNRYAFFYLQIRTYSQIGCRFFNYAVNKLKIQDMISAGSGNFLTETYLSLRRLENEVIKIIHGEGLILMEGLEDIVPIKVSIGQFYGIEINDFAVTVAKTAL